MGQKTVGRGTVRSSGAGSAARTTAGTREHETAQQRGLPPSQHMQQDAGALAGWLA